jgi:hypothetical protein
MIYPATYDITILQNATWKASFRVTQNRKTLSGITITSGVPKFSLPCHGYGDGDKVAFTIPSASGNSSYISLVPSSTTVVPCGLDLNTVYYVIASGLATNEFYVATSSGGAAINVTGSASGTFYSATPVSLSGYTVDSDIKGLISRDFVATFTPTITDSANGQFELAMTPATSSGIEAGRYGYDISLTQSSGERYYWLTGVATVVSTYSRN